MMIPCSVSACSSPFARAHAAAVVQGDGDGDGDGEIFVLQDLELKGGREGTQQHGPGAILEGAIGSCRDPTSLS